jgi:stage IV sporulation protein FB
LIKFFGVTYRFHPLFVLMMLLSMFAGYFVELLTLFCIVLIHELGHVAAAKGFGWRVSEVQLLPFGGVAITDEMGSVPAYQEIIVALSGPLQNLWMIGLTLIMQQSGYWGAEWAGYFFYANLMIGLFNLLPILPLDGGKVLQALLSYWLPYHRAIVSCSLISLCLSALFIISSFWHVSSQGLQMNMLLIGLFLLYSNWYGYRNTSFHFLRFLMHRDARMARMIHAGTLALPIVVGSRKKIRQVVQMFMRERYHLIYVFNDKGRIQGVLPEQRLTASFLDEKKHFSAVSELFM